METRDQRTTSEAQRAEHAGAVSEDDTAGERDNTAVRESAAAGAPAEQELMLEARQEQLAEQGRKAEEYLDQLQRERADFQNYRRRMTQERLEAASRGKEDVLRGLIPVLNNFRLALQARRSGRECGTTRRADDLAAVRRVPAGPEGRAHSNRWASF